MLLLHTHEHLKRRIKKKKKKTGRTASRIYVEIIGRESKPRPTAGAFVAAVARCTLSGQQLANKSASGDGLVVEVALTS